MTSELTSEPTRDLTGMTVVITGASAGIGAHAARVLAGAGARVVPIGRDPQRTAALAESIAAEPLVADFGRLHDVRRLAEELLDRHERINVLVHNAGVFSAKAEMTSDGFESTMQTNFVAPFLLHQLLQDRLSESRAHVVITASAAHRAAKPLDIDASLTTLTEFRRGIGGYATSKLADLMWARALARRTTDTGVTAASFHPGAVRTGIARASKIADAIWSSVITRPFTLPPAQGAEPLIHLATAEPSSVNGQYWHRMRPGHGMSKQALDEELGERLMTRTEELLNG